VREERGGWGVSGGGRKWCERVGWEYLLVVGVNKKAVVRQKIGPENWIGYLS